MENITYTAVRNPKWKNEAHTYLTCEVNFDHLPEEWVEFTCVPEGVDIYPHTGEIFNACASGEYGAVEEFVRPELNRPVLLRAIREDLLITEVDPIVTNSLRWNSLTPEKQQEWTNYRQALLDLPADTTIVIAWDDALLAYIPDYTQLPVKPV